MNIQHYLQVVLAIERRLAEYFIKVAEYHKSEQEIYYGCQEMASISNEHIRELKRISGNTVGKHTASSEKLQDTMVRDFEKGLDLQTDLRLLWILTKEAGLLYTLLHNVSGSVEERIIADACSSFLQESDRQSSWLFSRILVAAEIPAGS